MTKKRYNRMNETPTEPHAANIQASAVPITGQIEHRRSVTDSWRNDLPIDGNGHQRENGRTDAEYCHKLWYFTIEVAERPVEIQHVGVIECDVQRRNHRIGYR